MTNRFVDKAKENMGAIEKLLKGLPIVRGYVDKELRRDADFRLRQTLSAQLEAQKQRLYELQKRLMKSGGLRYSDDIDTAVQKLQTLADRIRTASYGYAGLFDAVKIREDQLDALHRFDVALAARVYEIQEGIDRLREAIEDKKEDVNEAIDALTDRLAELNKLYDERHQAVEDPERLTSTQAPAVDEEWMQAADTLAESETPSNAAGEDQSETKETP